MNLSPFIETIREIDSWPFTVTKVWTEEVKNEKGEAKKVKKFSGVYQVADTKNANNRVYPKELWEKILGKDSTFSSLLENRRVLGYLGHPKEDGGHLREVSHVTTKLSLGGDGKVLGESEILGTPDGQVLGTLLEAGVKLGISSRGMGESDLKDGAEVLKVDSYQLKGFDVTPEPSVTEAYPTLTESYTKDTLKSTEVFLQLVEKRVNEDSITSDEAEGYLNCLKEWAHVKPAHARIKSVTETLENLKGNESNDKLETPEGGILMKLTEEQQKQKMLLEAGSAGKVELLEGQLDEEKEARKLAETKLLAAEDLINTFIEKWEEVPTAEEMQEFQTTVEKLITQNESQKKKLQAAEELLQKFIDRHKLAGLDAYITDATSKISEEKLKSLKPLLLKCESNREVDNLLKSLVKSDFIDESLLPTKRNRKDLDPKGKIVTEDKRDKPPINTSFANLSRRVVQITEGKSK